MSKEQNILDTIVIDNNGLLDASAPVYLDDLALALVGGGEMVVALTPVNGG